MTTETIRSLPDEPLRQGDILKFDGYGSDHTFPDMGVIINADCDLEHDKIDGVIAYLPIYRFRTYLEKFWALAHVQDLKLNLSLKVRSICSLDDADVENLGRWLTQEDPSNIAAKLGASQKLNKRNKEQLLEALTKWRACLDKKTPIEAFVASCQHEADPARHAKKQITAAKKAISDGHFFVSEIASEPGIGFVIRMRRIYTIDAESCFTSTVALETSGISDRPTAIRFAHLSSMYSYRVAQLFAHQFSRVGLSDEITALGDLAIDDAVASLIGEQQ